MLGGSGSRHHTDGGTDRESWRLAAREIEEAVIRILAAALTSPASSVERFGAAEAILQAGNVALTATRLTELDLPLDWTEQHKLLAS